MAVVSPIKDKIDQFGTLAQQNQLQSLSPASSDRSSKKYGIEPAASDDASSAYSGETSDRRDTDISVQILPTKSEEYRLMFRLPGDEVLLQNFNCALQENIPLQGHMYLFAHHICFYSNIFGFETKKKISFTEITSVQKAKTAAIFPTAIEIFAGEKKHFFGSFLSRDEAYEFIVYRWALHNSEVRDSFECQDSKFDNGQDVFISDSENNTKEQKFDGPYCADREPVGEISRSEEALSWQFEDADAPTVPDYFSKVVETNFPVSLEEFFSLFLSDAAIDFLQKFHKICGDKDFQFGRWCHHENSGLTRNISFQHPIKIYLGAKFGLCEEIQKFHAYKNRHLVIETSQHISDVPYCDYFHVQGIWNVEKDINDERNCTLRMYVNVAFSKKTMWKGKIEQSTRDEYQETAGFWINNARELLKKKYIEKPEVTNMPRRSISNVQDDGLTCLQNAGNISESIHLATSHTTNTWMLQSQNYNSLIRSSRITTTPIFIKDFLANITSYMKSQTQMSLIRIIVVLLVIILMQLSIIIFITRTPKVHIVPETSSWNGFDSNRQENIDWLEKCVFYLTDEMHMIEARLGRIHREYLLLSGHLRAISKFERKS